MSEATKLRQEYQDELLEITMRWAGRKPYDSDRAEELRKKVALINHKSYQSDIPYYKTLCEKAGVGQETDYQTILNSLMVVDDIFKSYPQQILDARNFQKMNEWLSKLSNIDLQSNNESAESIDAWIKNLHQQNMHLVFSSGTSGHMSFVPRDASTWRAFTELPFYYLPQLLAARGVLSGFKSFLVNFLTGKVKAKWFASAVTKYGMKDIDGYFLNFSGGYQGIQLVGKEASKLTRSATFLYNIEMSATAVRALVRGAKDKEEQKLVDEFLETTVHQKETNYKRLIKNILRSKKKNKRVLIFGTPYLVLELCKKIQNSHGTLSLKKGSHVIYGGGWKSFTGEKIPENELLALIASTFGIHKEAVIEGYSMTEINGLMVKCSAGKYHVPPFLDTVLYDEALEPKAKEEGATVQVGTLGVVDPFATSYPGFIITGDNVKLLPNNCSCGLSGPSIEQVERSPGREVKGCGGIMARVNA